MESRRVAVAHWPLSAGAMENRDGRVKEKRCALYPSPRFMDPDITESL